jgi:hypothetical protein
MCSCPLFGKHNPRSVGRVYDQKCVGPLSVALMMPRAGMVFGRLGSHRFRERQALVPPGLNLPVLNFEVRVAYPSSIAHPGLSARSCRDPSWVRVMPFDNPAVLLSAPRSFGPSYSPGQQPRPSLVCASHVLPANGLRFRPFGPPSR